MAEDIFGICGTTQGNFKVVEPLMDLPDGVVYRAEHAGFRASVTLKCFNLSGNRSAAERERYLETFRQEAQLSFQLSQSIPEIVRPLHVDGIVLGDGRLVPYIAYEWLEGQPLDHLIDNRVNLGEEPLGIDAALQLLGPIANALARAHAFGGSAAPLVHGDLRPQNIVVTQGMSVVRLRDFGIASASRSASDAPHEMVNAAYAAPEQWRPGTYGDVGTWTDVWGLAITLIETMTGWPALEGDRGAIMRAALDPARRPTPRSRGATVSDAVEGVFLSALAVHPSERTADIAKFWSDMVTAARQGAEATTRTTTAAQAGSHAQPSPAPTPLNAGLAPMFTGDLDLGPAPVPAPVAAPAVSQSGSGGGVSFEAESHVGNLELESRRPPPMAAAPSSSSGTSAAASIPMSSAHDPFADDDDESAALPMELDGPVSRRASVPGDPAPTSDSSGAPGAVAPGTNPQPTGPASAGAPFLGVNGASGASNLASADVDLAPQAPAPARVMPRMPRMPQVSVADLAERVVLSPDRELKDRLRLPIILVVVAVVLTIFDMAITAATGTVVAAGPISVKWVTVPVALVGLGLAGFQLVRRTDD